MIDPEAERERVWDHLPYGPFPTFDAYRDWVADVASRDDPLFFAIRVGRTGRVEGVASLMEIRPHFGVIEIGHINLSTVLQNTIEATEGLYLLMTYAMDELGYRRFEWKCNALNVPSRRAAERYGFTYEGTFRNHMVVKGRNRDTAWYAITDDEWPAIRRGFEAWLSFTVAAGEVVVRQPFVPPPCPVGLVCARTRLAEGPILPGRQIPRA